MSTKPIELDTCTPALYDKPSRTRQFLMFAGKASRSLMSLIAAPSRAANKGQSSEAGSVYSNALDATRTVAAVGPFGLEFQALPAGEFEMGSDSGYDNEKPVHRVVISKPFQMGKYVVTQGQWKEVMGCNPSYFQGDDLLPVEQVSWEDIQQFTAKLNELKDGYCYKLPTEAEWEYAARTGEDSGRTNGIGEIAWYADNSGGKPHPVGTKMPNAWGLHDMYGNVWEWMQDCYEPGYYAASAAVDPAGPATGQSRTHRGGAWGSAADFCRKSFRIGCRVDARYNITGFRLVRNKTN